MIYKDTVDKQYRSSRMKYMNLLTYLSFLGILGTILTGVIQIDNSVKNLPNYQDLTTKIERLESEVKDYKERDQMCNEFIDERCTCIPYGTRSNEGKSFGYDSVPSDIICKSKARTYTDADRLLK